FCAARLPHERDVIHVRRAVRPLIRARQWRRGFTFVEAFAQHVACVHAFGERAKARLRMRPIIERSLKRGHARLVRAPGEIVGDDHKLTVAAMTERCEFHWSELRAERGAPSPLEGEGARGWGDCKRDENACARTSRAAARVTPAPTPPPSRGRG